jgi:hypothetical protein
MKKSLLISAILISFLSITHAQETKPNDRWFIKTQLISGYNLGKQINGFGYGAAVRCLYDFETKFLGGPVFLGIESAFVAPLGFVQPNNDSRIDYSRMNYMATSVVLEQNYPWLKHGFNIGTGIGYYRGVQDLNKNAVGLITNIGWFPIYEGKSVTPYITYRNDRVFDSLSTTIKA